jgi:AraC-like DNA-binding protein
VTELILDRNSRGNMETLIACGKKVYQTQAEAVAWELANRGGRSQQYPYVCSICPGAPIHLTSSVSGSPGLTKVNYDVSKIPAIKTRLRRKTGEMTERVQDLLSQGYNQNDIAAKLAMTPTAIAYHFKKLSEIKPPEPVNLTALAQEERELEKRLARIKFDLAEANKVRLTWMLGGEKLKIQRASEVLTLTRLELPVLITQLTEKLDEK